MSEFIYEESETSIYFLSEYITNINTTFLKSNILILGNTRIGKGTRIFRNAVIGRDVVIGENCFIGNNAFIRNNVTLGDGVKIGFSTSVEPYARIGNNTSTQGFCMISEHSDIGKNCFIGPHWNNPADNTIGNPKGEYIANPAIIKDNCRFGSGTRLVPGITIAEGTITGAMSLVTKDTEPNSLYYGVPAKFIRKIKEDDELR
jgi:acetyltransferase-like isoleucine patch superfamily enzyme